MTDGHRRRSFLAGAVAATLAGCSRLPGGGTGADTDEPTDDGGPGTGATATGTDAGVTVPDGVTGAWPAPGGEPGRTFRMRGVSGDGPAPPFRRVWANDEQNTGYNLLGPGGRLYNFDASSQFGGITVVDAASGTARWSTHIDDGSDHVGAPLWVGADAVVCSFGALDPADGARLWGRVDTDEFRGRVGGPTGLYGVVPRNRAPRPLRKRDAATGEAVWTHEPAGVDRASPSFVADGALYARADVGDGGGTLALDAGTGRRSLLDPRGEPLAVGPQYRFLHDDGTVTVVARGSGDAVWSFEGRASRVAVDRDRVYHVTGSGSTLVAREKATGAAAWRAALEPRDPSTLFVAGDRVYAGGAAGSGTPGTGTGTASGRPALVSQAFTRAGETAWTAEGFVAEFVTERMVFGVVVESPQSVAMVGFVPS